MEELYSPKGPKMTQRKISCSYDVVGYSTINLKSCTHWMF
uniref:Uncharacterized protein n=1 Tax=Arundo donax TaxID=35708 RepID=A0A0A9B7J1_ARUDO